MRTITILIFCVILIFTGCSNNNRSTASSNSRRNNTENSDKENENWIIQYNKINLNFNSTLIEQYCPKYYSNANNDLLFKTIIDIEKILGNPYIIIKNKNEEKNTSQLWIYMIHRNGDDVDNSALYIKFKNSKVIEYEINDFNGLNEKKLSIYCKRQIIHHLLL